MLCNNFLNITFFFYNLKCVTCYMNSSKFNCLYCQYRFYTNQCNERNTPESYNHCEILNVNNPIEKIASYASILKPCLNGRNSVLAIILKT